MDYSLAFYCGIFFASSVWTFVYAIAMRNRPYVNQQLIVPAFCSGLMWVVAQTGWFIANEALSQAIAYPIISACPALVSLCWGYFMFGEIRGRINTILFCGVIVATVSSVLMVAFSM